MPFVKLWFHCTMCTEINNFLENFHEINISVTAWCEKNKILLRGSENNNNNNNFADSNTSAPPPWISNGGPPEQ